jgi:hypothetical protein
MAARFRGCVVAAGEVAVAGSAGEGGDLDQVVGQDAVSAPGPGAGDAGEFGAVPSVAAFHVVDPAFGSGSPFDLVAEGSSVLKCAGLGSGQ